MAHRSPHDDILLDDDDDDDLLEPQQRQQRRNPYASSTRWRHQESAAFARHAAVQPRDAEAHARVSDLADFLNSSRISPEELAAGAGGAGAGAGAGADAEVEEESGSAAALAAGKNTSSSATSKKDKRRTARYTRIMVPSGVESGEAQIANSPPGAAVTTEVPAAGANGAARAAAVAVATPPADGRDIAAGPLLNYRRMEGTRWFGSVLVVTKGGGRTREFVPTLLLRPAGEANDTAGAPAINGDSSAEAAEEPSGAAPAATHAQEARGTEVKAVCLYSDPRNTFWRFDLTVEMGPAEGRWEYSLPGLRPHAGRAKPHAAFFAFHVPAITESMRIMFHSCNGFSVGTDEEAWSGPALWNDVLRRHAESPFHVMIGGGDQIYNDGIRVDGPLRRWTDIANPKRRRDYPFPEALRRECDDYYLKNYIRWYSTEPFASANGQIPQINIWDDHDIIDGFGSYVNEFMKCDVFRGIGGTAHKYYMLFQHHLPPPPSTYTTDNAQTTGDHKPDPVQQADMYVAPRMIEPNYIIGTKPGPYVAEHSHNIYARLGARMAFLGIDARTERTRHQVNYPETYDLIFRRVSDELRAAASSGSPIRHLILLLGIPIAYPRLTWLENILTSPIIGPVKFMNRRFGLAGGLFNHFDGSVDLLDDLDDHYTARTHKRERRDLVERLQVVCAEHSARVTILSGDVHLAALGRFYASPRLGVPAAADYRYMVNVVSSAITNKPPPQAIANLLARRNKIHHLGADTDETLMALFDRDPAGGAGKTAAHNHVTMPSRNFAALVENSPNNRGASPEELAAASAPDTSAAPTPAPDDTGAAAPSPLPGSSAGQSVASTSGTATGKDGHAPLHAGEVGAGTRHRAAGPLRGRLADGSLDVCVYVEVDQHDPRGRTEGYGMSVPPLDYDGPAPPPPPPLLPRGSSSTLGVRDGAHGGWSMRLRSRPATANAAHANANANANAASASAPPPVPVPAPVPPAAAAA